jgi:aarF domain-containing kinase
MQDDSLVPPELQAVLDKVRCVADRQHAFLFVRQCLRLNCRDQAYIMPRRQLEKALTSELGETWQSKLKVALFFKCSVDSVFRVFLQEFEPIPMAAASIGQVHRGVLHDGRAVAMKVQYPGADPLHLARNHYVL